MKRFLVAVILAAFIVFGGLTLGAWQTQQNFGTAGVIGPGLAVSGDIPTFNGTSGSVLQDPTNCSLTATILQCISAGVIRLSTDTGLSRGAAGVWDVGNGTQGDVSGTANLALVKFATDTGLSRGAAGIVDVGNGTAADVSGTIKTAALLSGGAAAGLTGTGACATINTQSGGSLAGTGKCTGVTAASTLTITPGTTAPTGWVCYVQDQTTRANLFQQTSNNQTTCVLTVTSVTQNDVFVFSAIAY